MLLKVQYRGVIFFKVLFLLVHSLGFPTSPALSMPSLAQGDFEGSLNRGFPKLFIITSTFVLNTFFAVVVCEFTGYSHACFLPSEQLQVCTTKTDGNGIFVESCDSSISTVYLSWMKWLIC